MCSDTHPWEGIYQNDGWPYEEPFPGFGEVVQILQNHGCRNLLDLGCGNGRHTLHLERAGFRTVGVDISPTGLRFAHRKIVSDGFEAKFVLSDMRFPLPFRDGCFEGIFSTQVIHHAHIAHVRLAIQEIWRVTSPGGMAFVSVSGKMDEDEAFEEIEPNTYVPLSGPEKGLPHHIFTVDEVHDEFGAFLIDDVSIRADGHVITILARKP